MRTTQHGSLHRRPSFHSLIKRSLTSEKAFCLRGLTSPLRAGIYRCSRSSRFRGWLTYSHTSVKINELLMTTFIALSILIEGKGAIKVKDNFPVLVQSHGQSERGRRSHHVAGRQARADPSIFRGRSSCDFGKTCLWRMTHELWQG